jgi:hypothetical protein
MSFTVLLILHRKKRDKKPLEDDKLQRIHNKRCQVTVKLSNMHEMTDDSKQDKIGCQAAVS